METLMPEIAKLSAAAILFVMWWYERADRLKAEATRDAAVRASEHAAAQLGQLVQLTKEGATAMATLIAEVRSLGHRHGEAA